MAVFGDRHPPLTDHAFPWEDLGSQVARAGLVCTRITVLWKVRAEFVRSSPAHLPHGLKMTGRDKEESAFIGTVICMGLYPKYKLSHFSELQRDYCLFCII